jgi:hypothetical protein
MMKIISSIFLPIILSSITPAAAKEKDIYDYKESGDFFNMIYISFEGEKPEYEFNYMPFKSLKAALDKLQYYRERFGDDVPVVVIVNQAVPTLYLNECFLALKKIGIYKVHCLIVWDKQNHSSNWNWDSFFEVCFASLPQEPVGD